MKELSEKGSLPGGCWSRSVLMFFLVFFCGTTLAMPSLIPQPAFAPGELLVAFQPSTSAKAMSAAHSQAGGRVLRNLDPLGVQLVAVPAGQVLSAIAAYRRIPQVRFAEPNYRRLLFRPVTLEGSEPGLGISNLFDEQWSLRNVGQSFGVTQDPLTGALIAPAYTGTAGADIDAEAGWAISQGSSSVNIAVLDSGISCLHADLAGKCVEQVNFVGEHGATLEDVLGHGTHVAAIAAAHTDNAVGTAGVAREAGVGSMKVCYEDMSLAFLGIVIGVCDDADVVEAINYVAGATDPAYQVINMSLAGPEFSNTLQMAVDNAWNAGLLLVAGAGNDYLPDLRYPAGYDNVIAVAATDQHDNLAYFSSFGGWVSVAAPGHLIWSAVPGAFCGIAEDHPDGCYDVKSGTSMATPIVSGVLAVMKAYYPTATNAEIRAMLESSAETTGAMGQNLLAWTQHGRVNLARALGAAEPPPPPSASGIHIGDLDGSSSGQGGTWTAQVAITVHDANEQPLSGATVAYTWSGGWSGSGTCLSPCQLQSGGIRKREGSATLTVDGITASAGSYSAADNHDPDGDSTGSAITVAKP